MYIKNRILVTFLSLAIISVLSVATLVFFSAKGVFVRTSTRQLETVADLKVHTIQTFFENLRDNIAIAQDYYNIKTNLPLVTKFSQDRSQPDFIKAKEMLDGQLRKWLKIRDEVNDIMLVSPEGKIVYCANEGHLKLDLDNVLPDPARTAFEEGKKGIFISQIFQSHHEGYGYKFGLLVSAPVFDFEKQFVGVVVFEINMDPIYKFIQDTTGLGQTGETLVVRKERDHVLFLNPLRHDPDAALKRKAYFKDKIAIPALEAASGRNGSGVVKDYRDKEVLGAWRYLPTLGWGLVAKIDWQEVLAPVVTLRNRIVIFCLIIFILIIIVSFAIARSISKPIHILHKGTEVIANGNFDYRVGTDTRDEVGQLSRAFDSMTEHLKQSTTSIENLNREITWRKEVQEALQKSESQLSVTLVSIGDAVIATDTHGRITFINPVSEKLTGWLKNEAMGKDLTEVFRIVNEDTGNIVENPVERALRENIIVGLANHTLLITKDGLKIPIDDSAAPIRDMEGKVIGVVLVFRDVTEHRLVDKKIKEMAEMKEKFAANVSHELRAPLGPIKEGVSVVLDGLAGSINEEQKKLLETAKKNVDRLHHLINNVLDFKRLETGSAQFSLREDNINKCITEVRELLLLTAQKKTLNFYTKVDENLPKFKFDREKIIEVITNLANNAIKFTDKGEVVIISKNEGNSAHIIVKDTGPGIKQEDIPRLFQSFQQLDIPYEKKTGGSGLGLVICKEIIIGHNGKIWVESEFGRGSEFHFVLPIKEGRA